MRWPTPPTIPFALTTSVSSMADRLCGTFGGMCATCRGPSTCISPAMVMRIFPESTKSTCSCGCACSLAPSPALKRRRPTSICSPVTSRPSAAECLGVTSSSSMSSILYTGMARAVQAVGGVLAGEEYAIAFALVARLVHLAGRNVEHLSRASLVPFAVELHLELAFEDEDPLLVGMRMRVRGLAGGIAHQCDNHPLAFDAAAEHRRVTRTSHDLVDFLEVEQILARPGALRAWCSRLTGSRFAHKLLPSLRGLAMHIRRISNAVFRRN